MLANQAQPHNVVRSRFHLSLNICKRVHKNRRAGFSCWRTNTAIRLVPAKSSARNTIETVFCLRRNHISASALNATSQQMTNGRRVPAERALTNQPKEGEIGQPSPSYSSPAAYWSPPTRSLSKFVASCQLFVAAHEVGSWHIPSLRGNAALRSLSTLNRHRLRRTAAVQQSPEPFGRWLPGQVILRRVHLVLASPASETATINDVLPSR